MAVVSEREMRGAVRIGLDDLGHETVLPFLDYLEKERKNSAVNRNTHLAAIH
jgi:hypothetical protein